MHVLGASLCPVAFAMQVNKPVVDLSNKTESLSQIRTFILLRFPKKREITGLRDQRPVCVSFLILKF